MKFHILTLFPDMVRDCLGTSILGRAVKNGFISFETINIRDFSEDRHGKVDDYTYGGGAGLLIQAQPVFDAWHSVAGDKKIRTVYVTPQGIPFTQKKAEEFAREEELIILCGHYEGIDERVLQETVTDYISIGDYVLTGGELPALVMVDAIARLVPGVLHNGESSETESFYNSLLEYPQYSRPEVWKERKVPEVLLSGNHKKIESWRLAESEKRTIERRPDLYRTYLKKKTWIQNLSKKKLAHIDLLEALKRGNTEILSESGNGFLLLDEKSSTLYFYAALETDAVKLIQEQKKCLSRLWQGKYLFILEQEYLVGMLEKTLNVKACSHEFQKYAYTEGVPLKTEKEISVEETGRYEFEAYENGCPLGEIKLNRDGSMRIANVWKSDQENEEKIIIALEKRLINQLLLDGRIPYCYLNKSDNRLSEVLKSLKLHEGKEKIYLMQKSDSLNK